MRAKQNQTQTLSHVFDVEGVAVDNSDVTVTVKNLDGETVSTGAATQGVGEVYTYALPAQATLGKLVVTWVGTHTDSTWIEIVGEHLFTLAELRSRFTGQGITATYTDAQLAQYRTYTADRFDNICGTSFARRQRVELVDARGTAGPVGSYGLVQVLAVNGAAFSGSYSRTGVLKGLPANQTATVVYEACDTGDGSIPEDIRLAGIEYTLTLIKDSKSNVPTNVESITTDTTTTRMVVPGQRGSFTGVPRVDAVLKNYVRFGGSGVVAV